MVSAASMFRKSGFNDSDAAILAKVAASYQNVADTAVSAEDAAASIVSQIRAFGEDASFATHVIDAYNEVANNFSVGTNDLSKAMEIAASGMATYGNSFEQVIGLVTSGTEIMQGRSSQVARGLSTIAARIVKNQDALAEYGITVENVDGSLKSTFDVLSELKPKWDSMTDAQRTALGDTIAGQNQYKVLASVMQNFGHAADATKTALESAGSAAQENSKYMESLEAKQQALKAEFEDFANRVLSKDLVSGFINAGTAMLNFANNDVGAAITRIGVLSTGITGLVGIVGQTVGKMAEVGLQLKNLGVGGSSFLGMLASGKIALIVGGTVAAITALVEVIKAVNQAAEDRKFENLVSNYEDLKQEAEEAANNLEEVKKKLQDLQQIPEDKRGEQWHNENEELKILLQYYEQLERARKSQAEYAARKAYSADREVGTTVQKEIYGVTDNEITSRFEDVGEYTSTEEAVRSLAEKTGVVLTESQIEKLDKLGDDSERAAKAVDYLRENLELLGYRFTTTTQTASEYQSTQGQLMSEFAQAAANSKQLTTAMQEQLDAYIQTNQGEYEYLSGLKTLTTEQQQFVSGYQDVLQVLVSTTAGLNDAASTVEFLGNRFGLTVDDAFSLAVAIGAVDSRAVGVKDTLVTLADGTIALASACEQSSDGTWQLASGLEQLGTSADGVDESVSTAEAAIGALTQSLFGANGQLTETAKQSLVTNSHVASMAQSFIQAQQAQSQANFENLISQIYAVGQAASITTSQISSMMSAAGVGIGLSDTELSKNLQRTYQEKYRKSVASDPAAYKKWLQDYAYKAGQDKYLIEQKKYEEQLKQLANYIPSYTGGGGGSSSTKRDQEEVKAQTINTVEELRKYLTDEETRLKLIDPDISKSDLQSTLSEVSTIYKSYQDYLSQLKQQGFDETSDKYKQAEAEFAKFLAVLEELFNEIAQKGNFTIDELLQKFQSAIGEASTTLDKFGSKSSNANATKGTRYRDPAGAAIREMRRSIENQYETAVQNAIENSDAERAVAEEVADEYDRQNRLLEDKIALEEKLEALEKAKQRRMLVYSEGRFQYMQDADAISSAQKDYQETYRGIEQSQTKELMSMLGEESKAFFEKYFSNDDADVLNYPDALRKHMLQYVQGQISGTVYEGMSEEGLYNTFGETMKPGDAYNQVLIAYQQAERARKLLEQMEADVKKKALEESVRHYGVDTDFGEKIKNAQSLDEVAHWTKLRDAKQQMIREYRELYGDEAASKYFGTDVSKQDTWKSNQDLYKEAYESGSKAWQADKELFHRQNYTNPENEWTVENPDLLAAQYNAATAVRMEGLGDQRLYSKIFTESITKDEIQDLYDKSQSDRSKGYLLNLASEMHKAGYPGYARGTRNAGHGLSLVGENGPELRVLNQGDGILPSGITDNLWRWGSMTPRDMLESLAQRVQNWAQTLNISNVTLPNVRDAQSFVSGLRELAQQYVTRRS